MIRRLLSLTAAVSAYACPAFALDELVLGMSTAPGTMNPLISSMLATTFINSMTVRPITAYDADWKLVCILCTEVPTVENGRARIIDLPSDDKGNARKGMEVDIELKPFTWADGTPLTARDVAFAIEAGKNPKTGVPAAEDYRRILKVEIKDDLHFTLTKDRVTFDYNSLDFSPLPTHIEKPIFDANPVEYRIRTAYDADPTNPGLAFGPYRMVELVPGTRIALERNRYWTGAKPAFDRVLIKIFENSASLEANLLSGNVDYVLGESGFSLNQAVAFERRHKDKYNVVYKPSLIYSHIDVKLDNPLLADRRVRRAILMAIDRKAISDKLFYGKQLVADGDDQSARSRCTVPARATTRSTPSGHGSSSTRRASPTSGTASARMPRRERLSLVLAFASGNRISDEVAQVIQSQLRQVGIELRLKAAPARIYFAALTRRDFDSLAMYCLGLPAPKRAAHDPRLHGDPVGGERMERPELPRLRQSRDGQGARRAPSANSILPSAAPFSPTSCGSTPTTCRCCRCTSGSMPSSSPSRSRA